MSNLRINFVSKSQLFDHIKQSGELLLKIDKFIFLTLKTFHINEYIIT